MTEPRTHDGLRPGGLMRCCIETVNDLYPDGPALIAAEGQQLRCKYANSPDHGHMVFRAGTWEWDHAGTAR